MGVLQKKDDIAQMVRVRTTNVGYKGNGTIELRFHCTCDGIRPISLNSSEAIELARMDKMSIISNKKSH